MVFLNVRPWALFIHSLQSLAIAGLANGGFSLSMETSGLVAVSPVSARNPEDTTAADTKATYTQWTISAIKALQTWYGEEDGLWSTTGWWNSANCLTVLGDFYLLDAEGGQDLGLSSIFSNTFAQAQKMAPAARKRFTSSDDGSSHYEQRAMSDTTGLAERGDPGFINDFYDDEGWWALAWIRAYDITGNAAYLSMAESIFVDMQSGLANATCGGGIWWNKPRTYKNAIANELYLSVAASLANRASKADGYLAIAEGQWTWFERSGMINKHNLVNDGLTINANGTCVNNGENTWSYNQGVILGGLVELYKATGHATLLSKASAIAEAAISGLSVNGILRDSCEVNGSCGADASQFKGIFMRNLKYLQLEVNNAKFQTFIIDNANSIWADDRNSSNYLGLSWAGPPSISDGPNASTQSSALDALVAAVAVS